MQTSESSDPVARRPVNRYQDVTFGLFCVLAVVSCLDPPYPGDLWLQHTPTVIFVVLMLVTRSRFRLSNTAYTGLLVFMTLHLVGARYVYSNVPYDTVSLMLFDVSVSEAFGFSRNHYDRLVHFCFGLCLAFPVLELIRRFRMAYDPWTYYFAIEFIVSASVLYELGEWLVAVTFAPGIADRYLGQQGDMWDAQQDMALALAGAVLAIGLTCVREYVRGFGSAAACTSRASAL